jgi:NAD(P)-dependent dehydrogenase (short-subunit alcohol dehydrogenase family)
MADAPPTIAIVGAGPGMGLAIAEQFGRHGFNVALVARTRTKLDELVARLDDQGIDAAGFTADVTDRRSIAVAFDQIKDRFGAVDVLEYSPAPQPSDPALAMVDVREVTVENTQPQIEYYLYGAITAAQQVLPDMLAAGSGTLLFTTGAGSVTPIPMLGNVNVAAAALRNWAINLHGALDGTGVYAAHIAIGVWLGSGQPGSHPAEVAPTYWGLYTARTDPEAIYPA